MSSRSNPTPHRISALPDRISALPDSVLHHILSFLPTKHVAATIVLSKRWKPLWFSLPTLNFEFNDRIFKDFLNFRHFVYSVMLSQDINLPLQSLRLKCGHCSGFDIGDINRFVHAACRRGIQNLTLDMSSEGNASIIYKMPPSVLSCKTLVVLKLKLLYMMNLPYADFPVLRTLHLDQVLSVRVENIMKLLSGSPILEDLQIKGVLQILEWWPPLEGEVKCLNKLARANISKSDLPLSLFYNAEFLRVEVNLHDYYFYALPTFHNLIHMELNFESAAYMDWTPELLKVLKHCPKLQNFIIHKATLHRHDCDWTDPQTVPECLSSQLRTCWLGDYRGKECELQLVKYILQNSKALHTMTIKSTCSDINEKHQMLMKLSLCPRGSAICKLVFD